MFWADMAGYNSKKGQKAHGNGRLQESPDTNRGRKLFPAQQYWGWRPLAELVCELAPGWRRTK